ncbi:MAG TPA: hypothetical protein VHF45_10115 [Thermoleophilaceae bacterium]|nr:hypothetical protein [Thermoleophilaceae bacterium]
MPIRATAIAPRAGRESTLAIRRHYRNVERAPEFAATQGGGSSNLERFGIGDPLRHGCTSESASGSDEMRLPFPRLEAAFIDDEGYALTALRSR